MKSKFLAPASHDQRQPMQSLFLFAGTLHGHVQSKSGRAALAHLERGLDVMKSLLDSLLDVSRLDAGVVRPTFEDFPVSDLLAHIAASCAPVARGKGLDWRMAECRLIVRSDRVLLATANGTGRRGLVSGWPSCSGSAACSTIPCLRVRSLGKAPSSASRCPWAKGWPRPYARPEATPWRRPAVTRFLNEAGPIPA